MPKKQRQATRTTPGFSAPFKGNPQQGTLFDKRTLLNPDQHIGPRGYSPERFRAVRATGIGDRLSVQYESVESAREHARTQPGLGNQRYRNRDERPGAADISEAAQGYSGRNDTIPEIAPDEAKYGPAYLGPKHNNMDEMPRPDTQRKQMGRARAKLVEDLARSTVPTEHLGAGLSISVRNQHRAMQEMVNPHPISGLYKHHEGTGEKTTGHISLVPERRSSGADWDREPARGPMNDDETTTLLHEIGHHASRMEGTQHSKYNYPARQGQEEAYADTYMLKHYREDRRGRNWGQVGAFDPREETYEGMGHDVRNRFGYSQDLQPHYRLKPEDQPGPLARIHNPLLPFDQAAEKEARQRPMLPGTEKAAHVEGFDSPYGRSVQTSNQARNKPVREMQQAYIKARWDPRNR